LQHIARPDTTIVLYNGVVLLVIGMANG
jgi:uncharacterized protein YlzI (FlbEa/FlbD family)